MNKAEDAVLYIVVPCFNEEEVLPLTYRALCASLDDLIKKNLISESSRIVFVDDGSKDGTWSIIRTLHDREKYVLGVRLSKNQGHQNALMAGMCYTMDKADVIISIDADLQDDISAMEKMLQKYYEGAEIVYGVRNDRSSDSFFKRNSAQWFYKIMELMGANLVYNHADYRLMSSRAVECLAEFKEVNLFLRGIVPLIGFQTATVEYERRERAAGESKYPFRKMIAFAVDGITSFSVKPIDMIITAGLCCFVISIAMLIYSCIRHFMGETVSGWTSLMTSIWAIGGLQVLSIGVVGKYIGKIYLEVKERPRFLVEESLD